MKIFLSWSGGLSHEVAKALLTWLPQVINALEPWLSSQAIEKGARWFEEIGETLSSTDFGIICLTQTNIAAPWILFEAGALSKSLGQARVCPLLIDLKNSDLQGPLSQFNTAGISREEIFRLMQSINARFPDDKRRSEIQLTEAFDVWWPRLEARLAEAVSQSAAQEASQPKAPKRPIEDILDEILELSRQTVNDLRPPMEAYWKFLETLALSQTRIKNYPPGTVGYFALELKREPSVLLAQLAEAGVEKADADSLLTENDKQALLAYLQASHGVDHKTRKKIILTPRR
ncbi:MAG: TIR domain-containing protein [Burkholderiaceae bacterium]|nr:TIR domain-containing protein [Burkholderiaceae bacterium]